MGIQHNSNKFTLEKHKMTKKVSNDLTSHCCLINRPIYSAGILNSEKIKPRAGITYKCFLSFPLLFASVLVPLPQILSVFEEHHIKSSKELIQQRAWITQELLWVKNYTGRAILGTTRVGKRWEPTNSNADIAKKNIWEKE